MRYIGNKTRLLTFIEGVIEKHNIEGETFADLFSGTGSVGDYFKNKYKILSNDFLYFSYIINRAKLGNYKMPNFVKFNRGFEKNIFEHLNEMSFEPDSRYLVLLQS